MSRINAQAQRVAERSLRWTITWLEGRMGRHSPIGDTAFFPDEAFPWARKLEENWLDIRGELDELLAYREHLPNFQEISVEQTSLSDDDHWKTYFFTGYGLRFDRNCERCPRTTALLEHIPGLTTAFFSILGPGKRLPEHRGPYKGVIRYHLAVKIPEPRNASGIRVGGQTAHWEEGKSLFFDDTYPHAAWNETGEDRVVLFVDVVRPLSVPYSWFNTLLIKAIGRSAFVQGAKSRHEAWEQRFERLRNGADRE